ncbi:MAG TPA: tRNA lysidine(34) synthetase, partial [Thermohalobaculum sp.]|nr:tRNA lysidine(34) synthetase [Thermohalobaculum sp.]
LALLAGWAGRHGLAAVLLGHTLDDQAETVLMRLARGSGAEGLAAMAPAVRHHRVTWLRPLLGQRRAALRAVLRAEGIGWAEDPGNADPAQDRVKARRALEALAPLGIEAEGLARTAERLARQRRVLERAMHELAGRARAPGGLGEARLDLAAMASDEEDTALRLLADTLMRVSGAVYRPRFEALAAAWAALAAGRAQPMTLGGCLIVPDPGEPHTVLVCREPAACEAPRPLAPGSGVWDRRWRVTIGGTWPEGARLGALGRAGLAALKGAAGRGDWSPPGAWASAPPAVRETTPALWSAAPVLLAAPLAGYLDRRQSGPGCTVTAQRIDVQELPSTAAPD